MENNFAQLEILLVFGTSFSTRQLCEIQEPGISKKSSEKEKLEAACRNGIMQAMLPEIFGKKIDSGMCIWGIRNATSFIELEMGRFPKEINRIFSIDPYYFGEILGVN